MLRGYRGIVAALGLILATHHPNAEAKTQQANPQERSAHALENIASRYDEQSERAEGSRETEQCGQGDDKRYSDLCAQWKAADAAADSAWWAAVGGFASAISTVLVLIALRLAFGSNSIARDTAKRQLRAYIGVDTCEIDWTEGTGEYVLTARLKNSGQTPAYNVRLMGESFGGNYPLKEDRPFLPLVEGYESPVNPGSEVCCAKRITATDPDMTMQLVLTGDLGLYIQGLCTYEDAFGESRETKFRYVFAGQPATFGMIMHAAETGNSAT